MTLYEELIQNRNAKLLAGGAAQNTARGAQVCLSISHTHLGNMTLDVALEQD